MCVQVPSLPVLKPDILRELLVMIFDQLTKCSSYIMHKAFLILVPICLRIQVVTSESLYLITECGRVILVDARILLAKRCIRKGRVLDEIKQMDGKPS
jgi:hypothetical protein